MYIKPIKIGNIELKNNIFLAPMAGVTDLPFRIICEKFTPGLQYTEMVSSKALYYGDENTKRLLNIDGQTLPVAVQVFGSEPEIITQSITQLKSKFSIIDINMGCPAPKVTKNGDGSSLLKNLDLIYEIVKSAVGVGVPDNPICSRNNNPITVKIRKGWDSNNIVALEVAKAVEEAGASAITVHGRTRDQFYTGQVDLDIIKKVKDEVNIPVVGNGDIADEETAKRMFQETGCDAIMIGRGAIGNPWIFRRIQHYLETGEKLNLGAGLVSVRETTIR